MKSKQARGEKTVAGNAEGSKDGDVEKNEEDSASVVTNAVAPAGDVVADKPSGENK